MLLGGGYSELSSTHTITVEHYQYSDQTYSIGYRYGYGDTITIDTGGFVDSIISEYAYTGKLQRSQINVQWNPITSPTNSLYFALLSQPHIINGIDSTPYNVGTRAHDQYTSVELNGYPNGLFTEQDIGKQVDIWLASTPPPWYHSSRCLTLVTGFGDLGSASTPEQLLAKYDGLTNRNTITVYDYSILGDPLPQIHLYFDGFGGSVVVPASNTRSDSWTNVNVNIETLTGTGSSTQRVATIIDPTKNAVIVCSRNS